MTRPSNDVIAEAYANAGSIRQTADALGWGETTLRGWAKKDPELAALFYGERDQSLQFTLASKDAELRELRRDHKKLVELLGKRQEWVSEMVEAARVPVKTPSYRKRDSRVKNLAKRPERSVVLPIFDLQYGQHVSHEDVALGRGAFDEGIFDARLAAYVEKVSALLADRKSVV